MSYHSPLTYSPLTSSRSRCHYEFDFAVQSVKIGLGWIFPKREPGSARTAIIGRTLVPIGKGDCPHWLGLTILALACLAFLWAHWRYDPLMAWIILIGSAAFDGLFYLWVGDAIVCYRCGAEHRGFIPGPEHKPFELTIAERYRQERLRRMELQSERKPTSQRG